MLWERVAHNIDFPSSITGKGRDNDSKRDMLYLDYHRGICTLHSSFLEGSIYARFCHQFQVDL
jgi:hypothetical protein